VGCFFFTFSKRRNGRVVRHVLLARPAAPPRRVAPPFLCPTVVAVFKRNWYEAVHHFGICPEGVGRLVSPPWQYEVLRINEVVRSASTGAFEY